MPKKNKNITTIIDMFIEANNEYKFWKNNMQKNGWNANDAIAAAQYYGQMCAFARVGLEIFDSDTLAKYLDSKEADIKLFEDEYV